MHECLFIGGSKDGQRIAVPEHLWRVSVAKPTRWPVNKYIGFEHSPPIELEVYYRRWIDAGISVFALPDMRRPEIMQALVEHYKPNTEGD